MTLFFWQGIFLILYTPNVWTYNVDWDQIAQNVASDHGLHCLSLIQQFLDKSTSSEMDLFKFIKYGKPWGVTVSQY